MHDFLPRAPATLFMLNTCVSHILFAVLTREMGQEPRSEEKKNQKTKSKIMEDRKNGHTRCIWRMAVIDAGLRLCPNCQCLTWRASCVGQNWRWSFLCQLEVWIYSRLPTHKEVYVCIALLILLFQEKNKCIIKPVTALFIKKHQMHARFIQ